MKIKKLKIKWYKKMQKDFKKLLVVDIEATCWENEIPKNQKNEVIEFGISVLDVQSGKIDESVGIMVKPTSSQISSFCTKLTTITPELIEKEGISFREACLLIKNKFNGKNRVWASFGAYDFNQIHRQCQTENVAFPLGNNHINVKALFALKHKLNAQVGMSEALKILKIDLEGTHHRGIDDSKNIAKILIELLK